MKSLAGIKHLTALKKLLMQGCSGLEEIDLSNCCPDLEELQTGFFSSLKTLRLGEKKALRQLYTMHNGLETLEFTALPAPRGNDHRRKQPCHLHSQGLQEPAPVHLAGGDKLKSFDLSGCDNLSVLSISGSTDFEVPDFSAFLALRETHHVRNSHQGVHHRDQPPASCRSTLAPAPSLRKVDVSKSVKLNSLFHSTSAMTSTR